MESNETIKIAGKVAKFPKNAKADQALKMLETIKVNPNKLWYILIESQDDTLKMVKYNQKNGVNLFEYTTALKDYYMQNFKDSAIIEKINAITVVGEDVFSIIKNIPTDVVLECGNTLLSKIANDLIILLNK